MRSGHVIFGYVCVTFRSAVVVVNVSRGTTLGLLPVRLEDWTGDWLNLTRCVPGFPKGCYHGEKGGRFGAGGGP